MRASCASSRLCGSSRASSARAGAACGSARLRLSRAALAKHVALLGLAALLAFLSVPQAAHAEFREGTASSAEGFHYLAKFCYDYTEKPLNHGDPDGSTMTLSVVLQTAKENPPEGMRLYVFDDQDSSWPQVYEKDIPCALKVSKSRNSTGVRWDENGRWEMPIARIHEHVRPRFWYIVAANCIGFEDLEFEVRFTNQGGAWKNEFGVNEQGLNTLYLVYFLLYTVGLLVQTYAIQNVWTTEYLHPIIKLLFATILLQFGSVFCGLVHYATFVSNGFGVPFLNAFQEIFDVSARLVFILLLVLIAQGWTISTDEIKNKSYIFAVMAIFLISYFALALWDVTGRDPASTLYVYESVPGMMIVVLDALILVWFAKSIFSSMQEETDAEKQNFYKVIGIGYGAWLATVPTVVLISFQLDPWVREYTVTAISLTVSTVAYFSMAVLLWPTRADKYFRLTVPDVIAGKDDDL